MILDDILAAKRLEVKELKRLSSIKDFKEKISQISAPLDFKNAVTGPRALIAEVKKASPSAGVISDDFNPQDIARKYEEAGANAISVLTETNYFKGSNDHLVAVRRAVNIPILRKDFIVDEIQIYEARALGADAILLIAAALTDEELLRFYEIATILQMNCLVEVHTKDEMLRVLKTPAKIIGINNRDLKTFSVDTKTTLSLSAYVPSGSGYVIVSESGIKDGGDAAGFGECRINALLVGEALIKSQDVKMKMEELRVWPK